MPEQDRRITFFLVAGEASGDLHGAKLMEALQSRHPDIRFIGHGGDRMSAQGLKLLEHVDKLAIMGFSEVLKHLPYMFRVMKKTINTINATIPDRIILIDYPGFNLRLAKKIHGSSIPITYFILPQLWAWKPGRIRYFQNYIDQALCIFPFEKTWFKNQGVKVKFVGHPFSEKMMIETKKTDFFKKHNLSETNPLLTLLPGSRQQEISYHWPIFLNTIQILKRAIPNLQVVVGKAPSVTLEPVPDYVKVESDEIRACMKYGTVALVASGTATLEAAVLNIPLIVCYKLAPLSASITRRLNKAPFVSIVNLIAERELVPEYIQENMQPARLATALQTLIKPSKARNAMLTGFEEVRQKLGTPGVYKRAATEILGRTI
ncbi:MAG: lipid-A-disaccharide synthase [Fidelibacterota bacterium]